MKDIRNFLRNLVGVIALGLIFGLNVRHALNGYGIKSGALHTEVLAQATGGTGICTEFWEMGCETKSLTCSEEHNNKTLWIQTNYSCKQGDYKHCFTGTLRMEYSTPGDSTSVSITENTLQRLACE